MNIIELLSYCSVYIVLIFFCMYIVVTYPSLPMSTPDEAITDTLTTAIQLEALSDLLPIISQQTWNELVRLIYHLLCYMFRA